jgi:NSS family neurotransmitter:Na+ symporter
LRFLGLVLVLILTMILAYYLVVTGWVLAYVLAFATGKPMSFAEFTSSYRPLVFFLLSAALCFVVVRTGVHGGIERLSRVLMPTLFVMLAVLVVVALSLPGASRGLAYYLTPEFPRLLDPLVWTAAFGQAFFSLGVGAGIMLTYAGYGVRGELLKTAMLITGADLLVALLGGLVVFPVVFSFGSDPAAGVQLAFVTLPRIFQEMTFGMVFGTAFFLLLFIAALTSAVSVLEVPVATLVDAYGVARKPATAIAAGAVTLIGLPSALSYTALKVELFGTPLLDLKDFAFGTLGLMTAGLVMSVTAGWFADEQILRMAVGGGPWRRGLFVVVVRFLIPLVLFVNLAVRMLGGA